MTSITAAAGMILVAALMIFIPALPFAFTSTQLTVIYVALTFFAMVVFYISIWGKKK
jgi:hypothetical protein